ncbi:FCGBP protein, partial [Galbula dea]|nr:FCGBP protein [Galbula dea]
CEVVDEEPTCVPETISTCWVTNSRHYHTYDGRDFDFVGTCTYILTKTCSSDPTLPVFSIEARNEDGPNLRASNLGSIIVHVYDITIAVVKAEKGIVRVNNHRSHLPISLAQGKLHLQQKGKSLLIQTDFKLKVLYDWEDHVVLKVPRKFSGQVCGMCGN